MGDKHKPKLWGSLPGNSARLRARLPCPAMRICSLRCSIVDKIFNRRWCCPVASNSRPMCNSRFENTVSRTKCVSHAFRARQRELESRHLRVADGTNVPKTRIYHPHDDAHSRFVAHACPRYFVERMSPVSTTL